MKLLHIDTGRDFRGGQELLLALARGLGERGHAQTIVCPARSPLVKHLRADGLHVLPYPGILALRRVAGRERFDLVHAHDGRAQNLAFLASAGLPVRRVASRHVAFAPRHPFIHRVKYDLTCHGVIALSESVRAVLRGAGVRDEKIVVIPPGIDFPDRLPTPEERIRARRELGIADDEFAVGHIAAFTPEKGQDVALDAVALLASTFPRARLLLGGDGPTRVLPAMAEKVRAAAGRAALPGFVPDMRAFLAALDLYIMPSRSEAWGLTALNAMAHGLAVVASNVGGLPEVVEHGRTGWLVPPGDAAALAAAIQAAAAEPARLAAMGGAGRARAAEFSTARALARTEAFYLRLLGMSY